MSYLALLNRLACLLAAGLVAASCLPERLQKYRHASELAPSQAGIREDGAASEKKAPGAPLRGAQSRPSIYAIDKQTFRFLLSEKAVWNSAINVLLRNYNLTIIDQQSGVITTEWDSYFLDSAVYRNKISLRVKRSGGSSVDVTIHNNVEKLRDAAQAAGTVGAVWLPAEGTAREMTRIVQNMALLLNQPPPMLPPGMEVARETSPAQSGTVQR